MENKKEYCQNLYKEWKKLKKKTSEIKKISIFGEPKDSSYISSEEREKLDKIKQELISKCQKYLSISQKNELGITRGKIYKTEDDN